MSTGDAAALLGITDRGVRDLARRGTLDARKSAGGVWLLDRGSVIDYAARRRGRSNVA
jgi:excisionase family DNA binding protein